MTDRRTFLLNTLAALPFLRVSGPRRTVRVVVVVGHGDAAADAARGAQLAAQEAERAASLLGGSFDLVVIEDRASARLVDRARREIDDGCLGVVIAAADPLAGEVAATLDPTALTVIETLPPSPGRAHGCAGTFLTGVPLPDAVRALAQGTQAGDARAWFLTGDDHAVERWRRTIQDALETAGIRLVGAGGPGALDAARRAGADRALVLEGPPGTGGNMAAALRGSPPVRLVTPGDAPSANGGRRVATWHPTLFRYGAEQLNERYRRAWEEGMSSAAWSAWFAVKALAEASLRTGADRALIRAALADGGLRLDGHKGLSLSFRTTDLWLRQPLYTVPSSGDPEPGAIQEVRFDPAADDVACGVEGPTP